MEVMELDVEAFRSWLLAQQVGDVVGVTCDNGSCPLACFLQEMTKQGYWVGVEAYGLSTGEVWRVLPAWAREFVDLVDGEVFGDLVLRDVALLALERAVMVSSL